MQISEISPKSLTKFRTAYKKASSVEGVKSTYLLGLHTSAEDLPEAVEPLFAEADIICLEGMSWQLAEQKLMQKIAHGDSAAMLELSAGYDRAPEAIRSYFIRRASLVEATGATVEFVDYPYRSGYMVRYQKYQDSFIQNAHKLRRRTKQGDEEKFKEKAQGLTKEYTEIMFYQRELLWSQNIAKLIMRSSASPLNILVVAGSQHDTLPMVTNEVTDHDIRVERTDDTPRLIEQLAYDDYLKTDKVSEKVAYAFLAARLGNLSLNEQIKLARSVSRMSAKQIKDMI